MSSASARSGRVEDRKTTALVSTGGSAKSAGDSLGRSSNGSSGGQGSYVTRSRVEGIRVQLNAQHRAVLSAVGRLGVASGRQLQRLHYGDSPAAARLARKHFGQLVHWRVLARHGRSVGGVRAGSAGYVYTAGIVGQRLLDPNRSRYFPRWVPRPSFLRHALAVSELYVRLREAEHEGGGELLAYDTEPGCWRRYFGPGGARSILKPDALAAVGLDDAEYRYFLEVDCATEHRPQIVAKAKAYVRYWQSGREQAETGIFPFVVWVAPDEGRAEFLIDGLSTLPAEHWRLFIVVTADEAAPKIASGTVTAMSKREEVT